MIWDDPWIAVATDRSAGGRFNTTLPPPPPTMPPNLLFRCVPMTEVPWAAWIDVVGTRWAEEELKERLRGAWVPLLTTTGGTLLGTCVLWPRADSVWILETLRARHGHGTLLMRAIMTWIWGRQGPFVLSYTWELSLPALIWAWWRGWLASAAAIEYGWVWTTSGCSFCPDRDWRPVSPNRWVRPMVSRAADGSLAIVNDSGMADGWGHVAAWRGQPNWATVAARGSWQRLWARGPIAPGPDWHWTGEFVVVGRLNDGQPKTEWVTAEV